MPSPRIDTQRPRCYRPSVAKRGEKLPLSPREDELRTHLASQPSATQAELAQAMGYPDRHGGFRRLLAGLREKGWM